jgi:hypothetical protein
MTDSSHIRGFRLFEHARTQASGGRSDLTEREIEHLRRCSECEDISVLFTRQFGKRARYLGNNGEVVPIDGYYKNVCCGLELYISAGKIFPDCRRHPNLPTGWKLISEDFTRQQQADENKGFAA